MPYEVKKSGSQFCVFKQGGGKVPGGCHATEKAAQQHMRALYANVPDAQAAAVLDTNHLTVVRDVEIMKTGVEYDLSTGKTTFTTEDLAHAVASQDDPAIVSPRIKPGHTDTRFKGDGEPALGKAINLRLTDNGHTIVGDYVGVPKWLAGVMASAYPSRSVEGNWNVETVTGNKWKFVIEAVALLGVQLPGISTLDDLPMWFSEEGPEGVTVNGEPLAAVMAASAEAAVNVDDVRQQYYGSRTQDNQWWWIRAIYLEPDELIVDDDDGQLYRVPFTVSGTDISYGDPVPVQIVYEDVPADVAASMYVQGASAERGDRVAASYQTKEQSGSLDYAAEKGEGMDPAVLTALGLPEDADTAQVVAAIEAQKAAGTLPPAPPEGENKPEGEEEDKSNKEGEPEDEVDNIVQLAAKRGLRLVDDSTWTQVQEGAKTAQALAAAAQRDRKEQVLAKAMQDGKFPPARHDHWDKLYEADPEGTEQTLAALASGVIPLTERGVAGNQEGEMDSAYPEEWFPDVAARKAAQALPGSGQVINEREVVK